KKQTYKQSRFLLIKRFYSVVPEKNNLQLPYQKKRPHFFQTLYIKEVEFLHGVSHKSIFDFEVPF
ncbi:hypothetical protein, partial [Aeribacillus pallidus]|uniref:hypothetical protein n=1 Tax=Aeribacillus pallidus TaxID=33936 RepID=UPI001A91E5F9